MRSLYTTPQKLTLPVAIPSITGVGKAFLRSNTITVLDSNLVVGVKTKDTMMILPKRCTVASPVIDTEPCRTPKQLLAGSVCLLWHMEYLKHSKPHKRKIQNILRAIFNSNNTIRLGDFNSAVKHAT